MKFFLLKFFFAFFIHFCNPQCNNYFPKIIGGYINNTYVADFAANNETIFTSGYTYD